jgi:lysophospholipase L1-like esterase
VADQRSTLTPHMREYEDLVDRAETRWLPYLMFFNRASYRSGTVNTDRMGFRYSQSRHGNLAPAGEQKLSTPVNLLVGNSTTFGVGATSDAATVPARLSVHHPEFPWLNFGARGYGSTQELLLFLLHRHLLPEIRNIVILSGFNELATTGLPLSLQGEYGGFFFSGEFYTKMEEVKAEHRRSRSKRDRRPRPVDVSTVPSLGADERIRRAVELTSRNLDHWAAFAAAMDVRLCFVLQAMGPWTHQIPTPEEKALFDELDSQHSNFWALFTEISGKECGERYAEQLARACDKRGIPFIDLNVLLAAASPPDRWLFVDRAHFNDYGYDLIARVISGELDLT